ncbi:hypothetical protein CKO_03488 [Citrobacter koseri ATCC BAA-895]|uniref:Uncharacterized protein n=1 Tax=Citrobacter koseri (strain ATCC BAA-895 / CDC 4225-83 / SGSC4696) TaxID=290338 RepID=A8AM54_CITK8|nr:hypothetical protein CKO_03488 [Citrobacter koseri ATCC BAA-895]
MLADSAGICIATGFGDTGQRRTERRHLSPRVLPGHAVGRYHQVRSEMAYLYRRAYRAAKR